MIDELGWTTLQHHRSMSSLIFSYKTVHEDLHYLSNDTIAIILLFPVAGLIMQLYILSLDN